MTNPLNTKKTCTPSFPQSQIQANQRGKNAAERDFEDGIGKQVVQDDGHGCNATQCVDRRHSDRPEAAGGTRTSKSTLSGAFVRFVFESTDEVSVASCAIVYLAAELKSLISFVQVWFQVKPSARLRAFWA